MNLTNKNIVIVGGAGRVGSYIRDGLVTYGANIFVISRSVISVRDSNPYYYNCDATQYSELSNIFHRIINSHGPVSGLVNCASYRPFSNSEALISENNIELWSQSIVQNSLLLHVPTQIFLENILELNIPGSVVTISSIYGLVGPKFSIYRNTSLTTEPDYAYNKSASIGYTRYMSSRYAKSKIRFNLLTPGGFLSDQDPLFVQQYSDFVPLGRMAISDDISAITALLLSDQASYITGTVIPVDGGWTAI
ncbi:SDR family oxidoreductase [Synechococcus sp. CBW1107]|uniref:SDR family oxidoreductase n=1 Tax=Synechococcus sp. CBW1107 TaxID=2789857 RepID=UPI002AD222C9|nr:SDR family oxidoreductase [Synechococcus sp. CBW1107]CAK6687463.1 2,5-dichloro-2,5-cyclohexadiene-1,4-diol dehydrogenase [Synechococcus sp. CBW1107]